MVPGGEAGPERRRDDAADGFEDVGQDLAVLVVDGDAALAGRVEPVVAELVDGTVAAERVADLLFAEVAVGPPCTPSS